MAGDFSRTFTRFDRDKGYAGVLMQQGRPQLDADWNEQLALQQHRVEAETRDVVGRCGTPKKGDGFNVTVAPDGTDLFIGAG